ncbi:MAG: hypothetical protein ACQEP7_07640 [bacterium]
MIELSKIFYVENFIKNIDLSVRRLKKVSRVKLRPDQLSGLRLTAVPGC